MTLPSCYSAAASVSAPLKPSISSITAPAGPTFALALGGGGARGLAHIHVIEVLDELGIRPVMIAGSSIGAIMGAGMAAGMRGAEIHAFARSVLTHPGSMANRIWQARPGSLREALGTGVRLGQFDVERIVRAFLPEPVPDCFEGLDIPFRCTATDYYAHSLAVLDTGDLNSALAASAAIPGVFRPVHRDGRLYVDGGFYDPVPFDLVAGVADIVIAVDVVGTPEENGRSPSTFDLIYGASQLMMQSIIAEKLKSHAPPDIFLKPAVSRFRVLDFFKIDQILRETEGVRDELRHGIERAVASWSASDRAFVSGS